MIDEINCILSAWSDINVLKLKPEVFGVSPYGHNRSLDWGDEHEAPGSVKRGCLLLLCLIYELRDWEPIPLSVHA